MNNKIQKEKDRIKSLFNSNEILSNNICLSILFVINIILGYNRYLFGVFNSLTNTLFIYISFCEISMKE